MFLKIILNNSKISVYSCYDIIQDCNLILINDFLKENSIIEYSNNHNFIGIKKDNCILSVLIFDIRANNIDIIGYIENKEINLNFGFDVLYKETKKQYNLDINFINNDRFPIIFDSEFNFIKLEKINPEIFEVDGFKLWNCGKTIYKIEEIFSGKFSSGII